MNKKVIETNQLLIDNVMIDLVRKNIKNLHLTVHPPYGHVKISAPGRMRLETIQEFAESRLPWIRKQQEKILKQKRETPRQFVSNENHYLFGHKYILNIIENNSSSKVVIRNSSTIDMYVKPNVTIKRRRSLMNDWYRLQMKSVVPSLVEKWERRIGVKVNECNVKIMKTKWGTCNISDKRIWLNLELAKRHLHCLEFIIVHELIHLIERYHNKRFYSLMDKHMPLWKQYKADLNYLTINDSSGTGLVGSQ